MKRLWIVGLVLVAAGGCRMCASPYDYCGPVYDSAPPNPPQYSPPPIGNAPPPLEDGPALDMQIPEESLPEAQPTAPRSSQSSVKKTTRAKANPNSSQQSSRSVMRR